jgi:hypothetical protein
MVFSRSSSTEFAGARYVGIDSSGNTDSSATLQAGQSVYNLNRWGDYLGASPDPDGTGIWVAGEFAAATQDNWGVQVGLTYEGAPPIPPNDDFIGAQAISGSTASVGGTNVNAAREFGEPDHLPTSSNTGEHSVWYRWTAPFSGQMEINTCTSGYDTALAAYTGGAIGSLNQVVSDDDACDGPNSVGSRMFFNATNGTTYRIAVAGFSTGSEGAFTLKVKDKEPPRVSSTDPSNNARGAARGVDVEATFSEAMQQSSINANTFKLRRTGTTTNVAAAVNYAAATKTARLDPNVNLVAGPPTSPR